MALAEAASCSPVSIGQFIAEPAPKLGNWPGPSAGTVAGNRACKYVYIQLLDSCVGCWERGGGG